MKDFMKSKDVSNPTVTSGVKVRESAGYLVFKCINTIIMILVCIATLYPFLYLVAQSFSSEQAIMQGKVGIIPTLPCIIACSEEND